MPAGRPRTVSLEPDEMIKLGEQMTAWIIENDPLHICQWYSIHMGISYSQWDTMIKRPEFVPYYEQALRIIGIKYLDKNSNVREGASQRWQRVYFKDLRDEEDETARFNAKLKADESAKVDEQHTKKADAILAQLSDMQSKIERNK